MGNIVGKRDDMVDGGFPFPTGTVYQKIDCDLRIVSKLISELRVSPFYKGLPDTPDSSFIECPICFLVFGLHCTSLPSQLYALCVVVPHTRTPVLCTPSRPPSS